MSSASKKSPEKNTITGIFRSVEEAITEFDMLRAKDSVLVGVSGGPDSVALVHILRELAPAVSLRLGIAHLNHGLRGQDADNDADFVSSLADKLDLPFHIKKEDIRSFADKEKLSIEEAARHVRYAFFDEIARKQGYNKIALGHHADDNAESILMFIIKGTGPAGMAGIAPVREERIIRPLIRLTRRQIMSYLEAKGLSHVTDSSNLDPDFMRNRIRHHLIPVLQSAYNPGIIQTLNRFGEIFRSEEEWLRDVLDPVFESVVTHTEKNSVRLSLKGLRGLHEAVRRRVIRKAIAAVKGDLRRISFAHVAAATRLLRADCEGRSLDFPDRIRIQKIGDALVITQEKRDLRKISTKAFRTQPEACRYHIEEPGDAPETLHIEKAGLWLRLTSISVENLPELHKTGQQVAFFDMSKLQFPLLLRDFQPGDRFTPLGIKGSQKVKKFFIDHKIPRDQRQRCLILLSGNRIAWVVGYRIGEQFRIEPETRRILKIELQLA
jgi:tRNA(Ile)-lysidine synthase